MKLLNLLITSIVCGSALLLPEPIMAGNGNGSTPTGQSGKPIIVWENRSRLGQCAGADWDTFDGANLMIFSETVAF